MLQFDSGWTPVTSSDVTEIVGLAGAVCPPRHPGEAQTPADQPCTAARRSQSHRAGRRPDGRSDPTASDSSTQSSAYQAWAQRCYSRNTSSRVAAGLAIGALTDPLLTESSARRARISTASVSRHTTVLRDAGLIVTHR